MNNNNKSLLCKILVVVIAVVYAAALLVITCINVRNSTDGVDGKSAYELAVEAGFDGTQEEWLASLKGEPGEPGEAGTGGADGANGIAGEKGDQGEQGEQGEAGTDGLTPYIGENGNWYIGEIDTGVKAAGVDGNDGIGVADAYVNEDGYLVFVYTDGTESAGIELPKITVTVPSDGDETEVCDHEWYSFALEKATCVSEGLNLVMCVKGDTWHIEKTQTDADAHNYVETVVEPTCEDDGYIKYTCVNCGDAYVIEANDENGLYAKGHTIINQITIIEPTTTTYGLAYGYCVEEGKYVTITLPMLDEEPSVEEEEVILSRHEH